MEREPVVDWDQETIKTYDESAEGLAAFFDTIGLRTDDIVTGLTLANAVDFARVVEIGCGSGRDAAEIVDMVDEYYGFDPSIGMLTLAQDQVPTGSFEDADALSFEYPPETDVVFAFASLLHVKRSDMPAVFEKVYDCLRDGGVFFISSKERDEYAEEVLNDDFGQRMFYYYNPELMKEFAGDNFETVLEEGYHIGQTPWFRVAFRKTSVV